MKVDALIIILAFPPCGTDIPYCSAECEPAFRHEFVDLRDNPDAVTELPEVRYVPELKTLLLALNDQNSIFRTFGCNCSLIVGKNSSNPGSLDYDGKELRTEFSYDIARSYVHVGFADYGRCVMIDDYYRVIGMLSRHLAHCPQFRGDAAAIDGDERFRVDIGVESLRMFGVNKGHILSITCSVGGHDKDVTNHWSSLIGEIVSFLSSLTLP